MLLKLLVGRAVPRSDTSKTLGLFAWPVADGWCWFILREKYWLLVACLLREKKYCCLVVDKPSEQGARCTRAALPSPHFVYSKAVAFCNNGMDPNFPYLCRLESKLPLTLANYKHNTIHSNSYTDGYFSPTEDVCMYV
jgi:hypothetical protein